MMGRRSVPTHSVHGEMRVCCAIVYGVGWDWGGRGESKILSNLERGAAKSFAVPLAQRVKKARVGWHSWFCCRIALHLPRGWMWSYDPVRYGR